MKTAQTQHQHPINPQAFSSLRISELSRHFVEDVLKYQRMTPVQQCAIPLFLSQNKDVVIQAATGSGKTLSYAIPVVELLLQAIGFFDVKIDASEDEAGVASEDPSLPQNEGFSPKFDAENPPSFERLALIKAYKAYRKSLNLQFPSFQPVAGLNEGGGGVCGPPNKCRVGAVILLPTRELASQVYSIMQCYIQSMKEYLQIEDNGDEAGGEEGGVRTLVNSSLAASTKGSFFLSCLLLKGGGEFRRDQRLVARLADPSALCVLIGTPGRVAYLLDEEVKKSILLSTVEVLVLDEADRLFSLGFSDQISRILDKLPKQRRTGLFSATITDEIRSLSKAGLRNACYVKVKTVAAGLRTATLKDELPSNLSASVKAADSSFALISSSSQRDEQGGKLEASTSHASLPLGLLNYVVEVQAHEKYPFLLKFLRKCIASPDKASKCIVFFLCCNSVDYFFDVFSNLLHEELEDGRCGGLKMMKMHGKMHQKQRNFAFRSFREAKASILFATDVLARGIDVPDVEWIIQADAPQDPDFYVHRIGRTARAGRVGKSIILLLPNEAPFKLLLEGRKITLRDITLDEEIGCVFNESLVSQQEVAEYSKSCKDCILQDRAVLLKASSAFVAYIRAYSEYKLKLLFSLKELDLGFIATSFCLLRIPRIKEILGKKISNFTPSEVNPIDVPFKDVLAEKKRQEKLQLEKKMKEESSLEEKDVKRSSAENIKNADFSAKELAQMKKESRSRAEKRNAKRRMSEAEIDELLYEENLAKKLKKGKITKKEFERLLKNSEEMNEEEDGDDGFNCGNLRKRAQIFNGDDEDSEDEDEDDEDSEDEDEDDEDSEDEDEDDEDVEVFEDEDVEVFEDEDEDVEVFEDEDVEVFEDEDDEEKDKVEDNKGEDEDDEDSKDEDESLADARKTVKFPEKTTFSENSCSSQSKEFDKLKKRGRPEGRQPRGVRTPQQSSFSAKSRDKHSEAKPGNATSIKVKQGGGGRSQGKRFAGKVHQNAAAARTKAGRKYLKNKSRKENKFQRKRKGGKS